MLARRLILVAVLPLALACGDEAPPPADPASATALELFALAGEADPATERIEALFGAFPRGVPADLYDSLRGLREAEAPEVTRREDLVDLQRVAIDLQATLSGGGTAAYSVQLEPAPGETWRVVWFQGPGVAWPSRAAAGDGLSTSPEP